MNTSIALRHLRKTTAGHFHLAQGFLAVIHRFREERGDLPRALTLVAIVVVPEVDARTEAREFVVVLADAKDKVVDGHHRLAAAILEGKPPSSSVTPREAT